jgi:hypothetical protein
MVKKTAYKATHRRKSKSSNGLLLKIGCILLLLVLVIGMLEVTNKTHLLHKPKVPPVIPSTPSGAKPAAGANKAAPSSSAYPNSPVSTKSSSPAGGGAATGQDLVAPYGTFVSNHSPGQNGAPDQEQSVCTTSPGASCYIKFTNTASNESTRLASQTTDSNGTTIWNWDVIKDAHLTQGQWQITAVATLSGQSKSTDDPLKLVIQ